MDKKKRHIIVQGKVQGVFFRACTRDKAVVLGLDGTVRNLPNGEVEILVAGPSDKVDEFENWCHEGSPHSTVTAVKAENVKLLDFPQGFEIL